RPHVDGAHGRDAYQRERPGQQVVEVLAAAAAAAQFLTERAQLVVVELVELLLPAADVRHVERGAGEAALPGQADDGEGLVPGPGAEAGGRRLPLGGHPAGGRRPRAPGGGGG